MSDQKKLSEQEWEVVSEQDVVVLETPAEPEWPTFTYTDRNGVTHTDTLDPNKLWRFDNPCDARDWVQGAKDAGIPFTKKAEKVLDDLGKDCVNWEVQQFIADLGLTQENAEAMAGDPATFSPPQTPAPVEADPSAHDGPPPSGGETADSLGAPPATQTRLSITLSQPPPGVRGARSLAEQYYAPRDPLPPYAVADVLINDGVPTIDIEREVERVRRNEPEDRQEHPEFSPATRLDPAVLEDPVDLFSGQFLLVAMDVEIPSRGFPLQLRRCYRSGPVYFGPWGFNWDHNYNVYLRELSRGRVAIWTGNLGEDVYLPQEDGEFKPPVGIFRRLQRTANGAEPIAPAYVLTGAGGFRQIFARPDGWPDPRRIPLLRLEDRHGNAHELLYDAEGRLERVRDHANRYIDFEYGDCGLLERVSDHTGRVWIYYHHPETEHLATVRTPATEEHPEGFTTCYEYDEFAGHPALRHKILRVVDPAGRVVVVNTYGDDPTSEDFGRVVCQHTAGRQVSYRATGLQYLPQDPDAVNIPGLRVEVCSEGTLRVYTFNYRGDLLDERFRLARDGSYRLVVRTHSYDPQGNLEETRDADGTTWRRQFDHENPDPRARGNLLLATQRAPLTAPAPERVLMRATYEPTHQLVKTLSDEAGPVAEFFYDHEQDPTGTGLLVRRGYTDATLPDGSVQPASESFEYNQWGQLIRWNTAEGPAHERHYFSSGSSEGYLERVVDDASGVAFTHTVAYDAWGNMSSFRDALGHETRYEWNEHSQVVRVVPPPVGGSEDVVRLFYDKAGNLRRIEEPRGTFTDAAIADSFLAHEWEHDELGRVGGITYGANTEQPSRWAYEYGLGFAPCEVVDPLGRKTSYKYDECGKVLEETITAASESRLWRYVYDRSGRCTRIADPEGLEHDLAYDGWSRLAQMAFPGPSEDLRTRVDLIYGTRDLLELASIQGVRIPGGPVEKLGEVSIEYDERGRPLRRVVDGLAEELWFDANDRLVKRVDARGYALHFDWDGADRIARRVDPLGNIAEQEFDAAGNPVLLREHEIVPGSATPEVYTTTTTYDARSREIERIDSLGNKVAVEYDARDLPVALIDATGVRVDQQFDMLGHRIAVKAQLGTPPQTFEQHWDRDAMGRPVAFRDPLGQTVSLKYNIDDEATERVYADGTTHTWIYEESGRMVESIKPSGSRVAFHYDASGRVHKLHFEAAPGVLPTPDLLFDLDGLNRVVGAHQGSSSVTRQIDARGRIVSETSLGKTFLNEYDDAAGVVRRTYPDGRQDEIALDALGRPAQIVLNTIGAAALTGGLPAGTQLVRFEYAGPQRLVRRELANGTRTQLAYDAGRRLTGVEHRGSTDELLARVHYVHDAAGRRRLALQEPAPAATRLFQYDRLSRVLEVVEGVAVPAPPFVDQQAAADAYLASLGSPTILTGERFVVDASDARSQHQRYSAGTAVTDVLDTDLLHQTVNLTRTSPQNVQAWPFQHDADGNRTRDDRHLYRYDVLDRLVEVQDQATSLTQLAIEYDPMGRVIRTSASGGAPSRFRYFGPRCVEQEVDNGATAVQKLLGAWRDDLILESDGANRWTHLDGGFSRVLVTDHAGTPVERYRYSSFGEASVWDSGGTTLLSGSAIGAGPMYGGRPALSSDLYDMRARTYDPYTGQFLQRDPLGYRDSSCLQAYARHDPVNAIDPTGALAEIIWDLASLGLGGASFLHDIEEENYGWAVVDALGMVIDLGAVLLPLAPGGVGAAIKASREGEMALEVGSTAFKAERTVRTAQTVDQGVNVIQGGYEAYTSFDEGSYGWGMFYLGMSAVGARGLMAKPFDMPSYGRRTPGPDGRLPRFGDLSWRPWSNTWPLIRPGRNPNIDYSWRKLFWDDRDYEKVSRQYWRVSRGAGGQEGSSLQHLWIRAQRVPGGGSRSPFPQGLRNAGLNLMEIPKRYNSHLGGRAVHEFRFRGAVLALAGATGTGAYYTTIEVLDHATGSQRQFALIGVSDAGIATLAPLPSATGKP